MPFSPTSTTMDEEDHHQRGEHPKSRSPPSPTVSPFSMVRQKSILQHWENVCRQLNDIGMSISPYLQTRTLCRHHQHALDNLFQFAVDIDFLWDEVNTLCDQIESTITNGGCIFEDGHVYGPMVRSLVRKLFETNYSACLIGIQPPPSTTSQHDFDTAQTTQRQTRAKIMLMLHCVRRIVPHHIPACKSLHRVSKELQHTLTVLETYTDDSS